MFWVGPPLGGVSFFPGEGKDPPPPCGSDTRSPKRRKSDGHKCLVLSGTLYGEYLYLPEGFRERGYRPSPLAGPTTVPVWGLESPPR